MLKSFYDWIRNIADLLTLKLYLCLGVIFVDSTDLQLDFNTVHIKVVFCHGALSFLFPTVCINKKCVSPFYLGDNILSLGAPQRKLTTSDSTSCI